MVITHYDDLNLISAALSQYVYIYNRAGNTAKSVQDASVNWQLATDALALKGRVDAAMNDPGVIYSETGE